MPYTGTFLRVLSIGSISAVQLRTMTRVFHILRPNKLVRMKANSSRAKPTVN